MDRRDRLIALLLSAALVAWLVPYARLGVDPHHDGIMLKPALDVLSGQTLFRDTFMQYGALSCYLHVAALMVLPTLLSLKLLTVAAYAATLFVLYASWRLLLPRSLTILACGLYFLFLPAYERNWVGQFWTFLPWSSVLAMFFQAVALHALLRVIRDEQATRWGLMLGVASAATFWCRQPVGIVTIGAIGVAGAALHWTGWKPVNHSKSNILLWTLGGFMAVHAVLLGGIWLSGSLNAWWYQNFIWPRKWAFDTAGDSWGQFFRAFLHPIRAMMLAGFGIGLSLPFLARRRGKEIPPRLVVAGGGVVVALCLWQWERLLPVLSFRDGGWTVLLPALVTVQAVLSVVRGFAARTVTRPVEFYLVAGMAAVAVSSLIQYYPVPDSWHMFWSLAPVFGAGVYLIWRWSGGSPAAVVLIVTVALAPSVYSKISVTHELLAQPRVTLEAPALLRGLRMTPPEAAAIGSIMRVVDPVLQHRPDIPAVTIGRDALYLCLVNNRANPSPYFVTWPGLGDETANQALWNFVDRVRPLMFFHKANWSAVNDFYRRARYVPLLYLPETTLEIAVPQELADAMGLKVYGANPPAAPAPATPKP
jgi:hypothetical protein